MKTYRTRVNPAFKQTQPLPVLPVNFAGRTGRAAMALSRWNPLQSALAPMGMELAGSAVIVRPNFNAPTLSLVG